MEIQDQSVGFSDAHRLAIKETAAAPIIEHARYLVVHRGGSLASRAPLFPLIDQVHELLHLGRAHENVYGAFGRRGWVY